MRLARPLAAPVLLTVLLTVLLMVLAGCAGPGRQEDRSTGSATPVDPRGTAAAYDRIPPAVRSAYFPRSDSVTAPNAPVLTSHRGRTEIADRQLPGCDPHQEPSLAADGHVGDFAWDTRTVGRYVVARQLTVYTDEATAASSLRDLTRQPLRCARLQGRRVLSESRAAFAAYPDLRLPVGRDRPVLREVTVVTASSASKAVDLVTRRSNAVVLTRVVTRPVIGNFGNGYAQDGDSFLSYPAGHPALVRALRRAAASSSAVLDRLG